MHDGMDRADLERESSRFLRTWCRNTAFRPDFSALRAGRNFVSKHQILKQILTRWAMEIEHGHKHFSNTDASFVEHGPRRDFVKLILFFIMARGASFLRRLAKPFPLCHKKARSILMFRPDFPKYLKTE